ncbi:hypothetical protein AEAC466_21205 [Asticcacaulis sp. AC466]|uniref:DUF2177 family protein n=1 Tax=Asticcacaulis sp. AC466 TaxID=1282362 RepID=UPI0003C3EBD0|nr:DUF2177 family protein [Asticcacaulis sp. AC466]ESQ81519.1 hypothetical protein AEAC466_21205 [Asticcacaulis sp. AC466]
MKAFTTTYLIGLAVLAVLDFIWLTTMGNSLYKPAMGSLMRAQPNMIPAVAFYLLYVFGLTYLIVYPALFGNAAFSLLDLAFRAALFGLIAYATYNLTCLSVINAWPVSLSFIDMAWGAVVTLLTACATAYMVKAIGIDRLR